MRGQTHKWRQRSIQFFIFIFWVLNLNQLQFFAEHSNQSVHFILYGHKITSVLFSCLSRSRNLKLKGIFPYILICYYIKQNRFHVPVHLFSNRSQRTSKCGKNISDTLGCASCATFFVLTTFWRYLWSITEQTHGNMESICYYFFFIVCFFFLAAIYAIGVWFLLKANSYAFDTKWEQWICNAILRT